MYHESWQGREQRYKRGCIHSAGISRKQKGVGRSDDKQEDEDMFDTFLPVQEIALTRVTLQVTIHA